MDGVTDEGMEEMIGFGIVDVSFIARTSFVARSHEL